MSLIFFYAPQSTATLTNLVLEELGVPHDKKKVDLRAGEAAKAELLKVNPNGKVPAIVHDGVAIWESSAITMYLGETFGVAAATRAASGVPSTRRTSRRSRWPPRTSRTSSAS